MNQENQNKIANEITALLHSHSVPIAEAEAVLRTVQQLLRWSHVEAIRCDQVKSDPVKEAEKALEIIRLATRGQKSESKAIRAEAVSSD